MRARPRFLVLAAPAIALALVGAAPAPSGIPFEKIAGEFLSAHGLSEKQPAEIRFDDVLASHFVSARLGAFDVYFPVAGLEGRAGDLKDCAAALLSAQEQILDWAKPSAGEQKALRADLRALAEWVKGLRPGTLAKCKECAGKDLTEALSAPESVAQASARLAESARKGETLGLVRDSPIRVRLLLAPTRKDFVELACFVGWWSEEWTPTYWSDSIVAWSTCWADDVQVIALESSTSANPGEDWVSGEALNKRDPHVMEQQVVQLSVQRVFGELYGEQVPSAFIGGLAMNLVIDRFGEINTRVDGDLRARATQRREVFVPGGASQGGFLPKSSAETRWRADHGKDRFVRVLRQSQKEGEGLGKTAANRAAVFSIRSDKGGELHAVHAPFLGAAAGETKAPPDEFQGDFAEMLRAYKCAFIGWLQTRSLGAEKASREKFAQLLEKLGAADVDFEAVFKEIYDGAPLSDAEAGKDCLEGRFLIWLTRQKG